MKKRLLLRDLILGLLGLVVGFCVAQTASTNQAERSEEPVQQATGLSALTSSPIRLEVEEDSQEIALANDVGTLRRLWERFDSDNTRDKIGREMVLARWAEVDPDDGFEFFLKDAASLEVLLVEWAVIDIDAMVARLLVAEKWRSLIGITRAMIWRKPELCFELISAWKDASGRGDYLPDGLIKFAMVRLYGTDPQKALALAQGLSPDMRGEALEGIAVAMAREDSQAALAWAEALEDPAVRATAIGSVIVEIGKVDAEAVVPLLAALEKPFKRGAPGNLLVWGMVVDDPKAAIAWLERNFVSELTNSELTQMIVRGALNSSGELGAVEAIASSDDEWRSLLIARLTGSIWYLSPEKLIEGVDRVPSREVRMEMRTALLGSLADSDVMTAIDYVKALPQDEFTPELWGAVLGAAGAVSFYGRDELFWKLVTEVPEAGQTKLLTDYLAMMVHEDGPDALERLAGFREHPGYAEIAKDVMRSMSIVDPQATMDWIGGLEGELQWDLARSFAATRMGTNSVAEVYEWMRSIDLPEPYLEAGTGWLVMRWSGVDGIGASKFILGMEPGPIRQRAIAGLVSETHRLDPDAALEWVHEIEDQTTRQKWVRRVEAARAKLGRIGDR